MLQELEKFLDSELNINAFYLQDEQGHSNEKSNKRPMFFGL